MAQLVTTSSFFKIRRLTSLFIPLDNLQASAEIFCLDHLFQQQLLDTDPALLFYLFVSR